MDPLKEITRLFDRGNRKYSEYFCIYKNNQLKWILPKEKKFALYIIDNWTPYSLKGALFWKLIKFLFVLGIPNFLSNVKIIKMFHDHVDWNQFGWSSLNEPILGFYIGTKSIDQKISILLIDKKKIDIKLVVKLPVGENSWELIHEEYNVLKKLNSKSIKNIPKPFLKCTFNYFAVQNFLKGKPSKINLTNAHYKFLSDLVYKKEKIALKNLRNYLISYYKDNEISIRNYKFIKTINFLVSRLDSNKFFPLSFVHCDFVPWNIKTNINGNIYVYDWEYSHQYGIPFYDIFYYKYQIRSKLKKNIEVNINSYMNNIMTKCQYQDIEVLNLVMQVSKLIAFININNIKNTNLKLSNIEKFI